MVRKNCYELMDAYYADAIRKVSEERSFLDSASDFVNIKLIRKTKNISHGNERFFL